jgi:hypothetical protein
VLGRLQGHPLALTWAASLLARRDESPPRLLAEWDGVEVPAHVHELAQAGQNLLEVGL